MRNGMNPGFGPVNLETHGWRVLFQAPKEKPPWGGGGGRPKKDGLDF